MKDPIVVDPPGFDCSAAWRECSEYVEKCGGLVHEDGEPNWRAAFGADPGCCSCPACHVYFWSWGRIIECTDCGFRFPTDWWCRYSWGSQQAHREKHPPPAMSDPRFAAYIAEEHAKSMNHPYYRYGYEHPSDDAVKEKDRIDWRTAVGPIEKVTWPRLKV